MTGLAPDSLTDEPDVSERRDTFPIVGIGASAGGLEALSLLLKALPVDTGMGFVLVQHLDPVHASNLSEILARATRMPITEVRGEQAVEPNQIFIIPPGSDMVIERGMLQLVPRPSHQHRPIDLFLRALARDRGHKTIGVILSGTATDGSLGLEDIKAAGGIVFAQDGTAQYDGMPRSAIATGCVDFILPPDEIAREIARIARHSYVAPSDEAGDLPNEHAMGRILETLRAATGVDFAQYKTTTLGRRLNRRLALSRMEDLEKYAQYLRDTPGEPELLFKDLLISVTSFFRNPETFEALKDSVFPALFRGRKGRDPLRIWVIGCSTGEEAYSIAMSSVEFAETSDNPPAVQVFATDLNEESIARARAGDYSSGISDHVSPERLRRFFVDSNGARRINKSIRDMCVFARHDLLSDPPFSRIDLISCRNLLIYLKPAIQQRIIPLLHYSLMSTGYLLLGASETIGSHGNLFGPAEAGHRIYSKKPGSRGATRAGAVDHPAIPPDFNYRAGAAREIASRRDLEAHKTADRILLAKYAPPAVLVNADLEVLQFRGDTGPYLALAPAPGKASLNLFKMARKGLLTPLRSAVSSARREQAAVRQKNVRVQLNGGIRGVNLEVIPLRGGGPDAASFLVLFEDAGTNDPPRSVPPEPSEALTTEHDSAHLAQELAATREYLQLLLEQQEASNEELQAASEEVQSSNEELQSINEELETSKEEIQSSNEELVTVNDELRSRNSELDRLNNDLVNVFANAQLAIVIVGLDLRIRRFTPAAESLFQMVPSDVGRPINDLRLNLRMGNLDRWLADVIREGTVREQEVQDTRGRWYSLRIRPYQTIEQKIDGAVIVLVDVDAVKRALEYAESLVATLREPLLVLDEHLHVQKASPSFYRVFKTTPEETEGRLVYELGNGQWDIPRLRHLLEAVLPRDNAFDDVELEHEFEAIGRKAMVLNARRVLQAKELPQLILLAIEDVTERKHAATALLHRNALIQSISDNIESCTMLLDETGCVVFVNPAVTRITGYTLADFAGRTAHEVFHQSRPSGVACTPSTCPIALATSRQQILRNYHDNVLRKDGTFFPASCNFVPFAEDDRPAGALFEVRDRSAEIQAADEIRRLNATLEQRVLERTRELQEINDQLLTFSYSASHDLRAPLRAIRGYLEALIDESGTTSNPLVSEYGQRIIEATIRMDSLILNLLAYGRLSKMEIILEDLDVDGVVAEALLTASDENARSDGKINVSLPPHLPRVRGHHVTLVQAVANLISNAMKFVAPETEPRVRITAEVFGDRVRLWIVDNGIGIAPEHQVRIFQVFEQLHPRAQFAGTGIGLAMVKRALERMSGSVGVESAFGAGSRFWIELPTAS